MSDFVPESIDTVFFEEVLSERRIYSGRIFDFDELTVRFPNGSTGLRDVIRHPGATGIVALDASRRVLLTKQWRTALGKVAIEIPAGRLEQGEDPLKCAERELAEETGYTAGQWEHLTTIETCAGFCDERLHIYVARDLTTGETNFDDDEFVTHEWVELSTAVEGCFDGTITDSKTVVGLLMVGKKLGTCDS